MPCLLTSFQKHIARFLTHVNTAEINRFHTAVGLAHWGGCSFSHTYLWLEAGGITEKSACKELIFVVLGYILVNLKHLVFCHLKFLNFRFVCMGPRFATITDHWGLKHEEIQQELSAI
jgi:hypothetical protein